MKQQALRESTNIDLMQHRRDLMIQRHAFEKSLIEEVRLIVAVSYAPLSQWSLAVKAS